MDKLKTSLTWKFEKSCIKYIPSPYPAGKERVRVRMGAL